MGFFKAERRELRTFDEGVLAQTKAIGKKFGAIDPLNCEANAAFLNYKGKRLECALIPLDNYGRFLMMVDDASLTAEINKDPQSFPHRKTADMPKDFWVLDIVYLLTEEESRGKGLASLLAHIGDAMVQEMADYNQIPIYAFSCADKSKTFWSTTKAKTFNFEVVKKEFWKKLLFLRDGLSKWYFPEPFGI